MRGDAGQREIDRGVLRGALPESNQVGFGFVETARVVTVAQGTGEAELVLRVGRIAGEGGSESSDGVVVVGGGGGGETLDIELATAGLLIGVIAGDQMAHCGEGDGGAESQDEKYDWCGAGDRFGERPGHISYHDIILPGLAGCGLSTKVGMRASASGKILRLPGLPKE